MTILIDHESSVTQVGSGEITPTAQDRTTSLATSISGGAGAVAAPPERDESPAEAGADVTLDEIFDFDLSGLAAEADREPPPSPPAPPLVCATAGAGQPPPPRHGDDGIVLTAAETRTVYEFLADSARIWGAAL